MVYSSKYRVRVEYKGSYQNQYGYAHSKVELEFCQVMKLAKSDICADASCLYYYPTNCRYMLNS